MGVMARDIYFGMGPSYALLFIFSVGCSRMCQSFVGFPTATQSWKPSCWKLPGSFPPQRSSGKAVPRSKVDQEGDMFDWLANNSGVEKTVSLGVVGGGCRGLLADCDIQQGQVVLEVPSRTCLWSNRDGVVSGIYGQTDMCWEAAGDLRDPVSDEDFARGMTWDVRLALGLLEALSEPQIGGQLWPAYGRLLPQPHTVTVPFCLPERLLIQLHNEGMAERARRQVERLRSLYPSFMQTLLSHPITAVYAATRGTKKTGSGDKIGPAVAESDVAPMALAWTFAMVRSRAFAGGDGRFAFVPFLDMVNHGFAPSANFTFEDPGVFRLRAMRDIRTGEEVTISYGESLDAEQLMVQYGFPVPPTAFLSHPLANHAPWRERSRAAAAVPDGEGDGREASAPGGQVRRDFMEEMFLRGQQRFAREVGDDSRQFEALVRRAIPIIFTIATMVENSSGGAGIPGARAYLKELQAYRSENFPTSEEQDRELLTYCVSEGKGKGKVDQRLADVLRYRIARKEAHSMAVDILEEYLSSPEVSGR